MKRTKNEFFLKVYRDRWINELGTCRWGASLFRHAFGNPGKLPAMKGEWSYRSVSITSASGMEIRLYLIPPCRHAKGARAYYLHRVLVVCPECNDIVPAGRIHQHTC